MMLGGEGNARLAERLSELTAGDAVADIGCGPGTAARHAATSAMAFCRPCRYRAADATSAMAPLIHISASTLMPGMVMSLFSSASTASRRTPASRSLSAVVSAGTAAGSAAPACPSATTAFFRALASGCFRVSTQWLTGWPWVVSGTGFWQPPRSKSRATEGIERMKSVPLASGVASAPRGGHPGR